MIKLGLVSAILPDYTFEQVIEIAAKEKLKCIEVMCWPKGKALRRYAGITHINVNQLTEEKAQYYAEYAKERGIEISALGYYPNPLDSDLEVRNQCVKHLYQLIDGAKLLGVTCITTFIGRNRTKNLEENLLEMVEVWTPIVKYAYEKNIKIAIENCPMYYTKDEWPEGNNLASTPYVWRTMFEKIPFDNLGLNYDPSHMLLQGANYIQPIYEFADRIFHVHIKDIKMYQNKIDEYGMFGYPGNFHSPKIPGMGNVNWAKFMSAIYDIGYDDCVCIEIEDKSFEHNNEDVLKSIEISTRYISNFYA